MSLDDYIKAKIKEDFNPVDMTLINESHKHAGHAGDDGSGETHYLLKIVSQRFEGLNRVSRQRLVNESLEEAYKKGLHAMSYRLFSPSELN